MSPAISSSVRPSAAVRVMNPPTGPGRRALQNALQAQPFFIAGDLARNAHVFERRHVHHVAPRQRDVRSDARALLPQRLLGDLDDDLLAFLEQIGDGRLLLPRRETGRATVALRGRRGRPRFGTRLRASRPGSRHCSPVWLVRPALPRPPRAAHAARDAMRIAAAALAHRGGAAVRFARRGTRPRLQPASPAPPGLAPSSIGFLSPSSRPSACSRIIA